MPNVLASTMEDLQEGVDDLLRLRFLEPLGNLAAPFGPDKFGAKAEGFARFFGTPKFLIGQTVVVAAWIAVNAAAVSLRWDVYPFILLNLVFSTQAAYAAPLILLAQTRQADRDKALAEADAKHREALAQASTERQEIASQQGAQLRALLESNTAVTEQNARLTAQLHELTREIHASVCVGER